LNVKTRDATLHRRIKWGGAGGEGPCATLAPREKKRTKQRNHQCTFELRGKKVWKRKGPKRGGQRGRKKRERKPKFPEMGKTWGEITEDGRDMHVTLQ